MSYELTVCRVAQSDRFAFIFHIRINFIKDPYCGHAVWIFFLSRDNPRACAAAYVDEFLKWPQISRFSLKHDS